MGRLSAMADLMPSQASGSAAIRNAIHSGDVARIFHLANSKITLAGLNLETGVVNAGGASVVQALPGHLERCCGLGLRGVGQGALATGSVWPESTAATPAMVLR